MRFKPVALGREGSTPSPGMNGGNMSEYQTFLFTCDCENRGIIFRDNIPFCRWCRSPLSTGGKIRYEDEYFPDHAELIQRLAAPLRGGRPQQ